MKVAISQCLVLAAFWASCAGGAEQARIPLVKGLTIVSASHRPNGDYETVTVVSDVTADAVEFSDEMATADGKSVNGLTHFKAKRIVRKVDLKTAHRMNVVMQTGDPNLFAGATYMQLSAEVLQELRGKGESAFIFGWSPGMGAYDLMSAMLVSGRKYYRGQLKRVGIGSVNVAVLVNGRQTSLPSVHTQAHLSVGSDTVDTEAWWLDDPENPLLLRTNSTGGGGSQVVRIDYPAAGDTALSAGLGGSACRAELHGVYFSTASAELLPESASTLKQVAELLKAHPDWQVTVEGHTDNIGAPSYNLDLSQRRAASVRSALTHQFGLAANRISVNGYGLSRPVDSNVTLVGRAHNRRVELSRKCHSIP